MVSNGKWVDRKFEFNFAATKYVDFLKFLRSTPSRLYSLTRSIPEENLIQRDGNRWSIQENVGHLVTVEKLFIGRLDDYLNAAPILRAADVTGKRTYEADYNSKEVESILVEFRELRLEYLKRLEVLPLEDFNRNSFHPRLKTKMRLCDMLYFQVEHDKHHLLRIEELRNQLF